jgi:chromosome segregation ATPase
MELTQLMQCIASTFGVKVGEAIKVQIANVLSLENVDVASLQANIAAIQAMLGTGDTATTIIANLTALTARVAALEGDTRIAAAQTAIVAMEAALATETARALAAEAALAAQIGTINGSLSTIGSQIAALQSGQTGCDCTALAASIAANSTAIANLQGVDAAQAAQIAALQATVEGLSTSLASASAAATAAASAAAAAQATANAAAAAAAAARAAVDDLDDRERGHHEDHETKLGGKVSRAEVAAIDCVSLGALFAAGIQLGLNPLGY